MSASESAVIGLIIGTCAFLTALVAIKIYIYAAPKIGAIAYPTRRGSHKAPIVTGGGLPILVVFALLLLCLEVLGFASGIWPYTLWGAVISVLGYLDDLDHVPIVWRLLVQVIASLSFVTLAGSFQLSPQIPQYVVAIITSVLIVVFINVFNFMDGSDGMVGLHGILVLVGWAGAGIIREDSRYIIMGFGIAGLFAAFLLINWHPAKVFLGDSGSTLLGFLVAIFPLIGQPAGTPAPAHDLLLVILFSWILLFDTVFTRLQRLFRESRFWEPNRDHCYQRLIDSGSNQGFVAGLYGLLTAIMIVVSIATIVFGGAFSALLVICLIGTSTLLYLVSRKKEIDLNA